LEFLCPLLSLVDLFRNHIPVPVPVPLPVPVPFPEALMKIKSFDIFCPPLEREAYAKMRMR